MRSVNLAFLAALAKVAAATYVLQDDYQPDNFLDKFKFFSGADPSNAYVTYLDKNAAFQEGLAKKKPNSIHIGADHKSKATGVGRKTVRIESKKTFKHGLIVVDIAHMPGSICGVWPAFWLSGSRWPEDGEFDILEGVNRQQMNKMALHATKGCTIKRQGDFTGKVETTDCDVYSPTQPGNQGCLFSSNDANSYGTGFNQNGGGVYAFEWTSKSITVWFFPRGNIPKEVNSANPDPASFGKPSARFVGCDFDKYFKEQRIIFNTAFCGDWSKGLWGSDSTCAAKNSCEDYVKNNPGDFKEAFWEINSLKLFQEGTAPPSSSPNQPPSATGAPTASPTQSPPSNTDAPSGSAPGSSDSPAPTGGNSSNPAEEPSGQPTQEPTGKPTGAPTENPSETNGGALPTDNNHPSCKPTRTTCTTYTTVTTVKIVGGKTLSEDAPAPTSANPSVSGNPISPIDPTALEKHMRRHAARRHGAL